MTDTPPTSLAVEYLLQILDVAELHAPEGAREWFVDGGKAFLRNNDSLDKCLGLSASKQGSRRAARMYNAWERDRYLIEAHQCVSGKTSWARSVALAEKVSDFRQRWERYQHLDAPPAEWSDLSMALFYAFKYGSKYKNGLPPSSVTRLNEIYLQQIAKWRTLSVRPD